MREGTCQATARIGRSTPPRRRHGVLFASCRREKPDQKPLKCSPTMCTFSMPSSCTLHSVAIFSNLISCTFRRTELATLTMWSQGLQFLRCNIYRPIPNYELRLTVYCAHVDCSQPEHGERARGACELVVRRRGEQSRSDNRRHPSTRRRRRTRAAAAAAEDTAPVMRSSSAATSTFGRDGCS